MTSIEALAQQADEIINSIKYTLKCEHGIEVEPGFFIIYNTNTGQSKTVLYHPESGMIFKNDYSGGRIELATASNRYIGIVSILDREFRVRLPEYYIFGNIAVQEYVIGDNCGCDVSWCQHAVDIKTLTKCNDTHTGNWKIMGDEIVLFDFDGIIL